ncbi:rCG36060 [Rattus norvegicus]|uniref:RCG36060 n=1 Tax=Rattus norvegicus TaxID=10116 RepID=A6IJP9_RAT|nr:rCG36060 [Rattus norvegicus]
MSPYAGQRISKQASK